MLLTPRELELLPVLPNQGVAGDRAAPADAALVQAAASIGADPLELARLQAKLAADTILRERVYTLQAWDRQLAATMPQVAVPMNLELHVRQALAIAEPTLAPVNVAGDAAGKQHSRRRWLQGIALGGSVALASYLGWLTWPRARTLDPNEIAAAGGWLDRYVHNDRWLSSNWPFEEYPLPAVIRPQPFGWQSLSKQLQTPTVAYDYSTNDGQRAALFVISQPAGTFTTRVPFRPQDSTQGMCVGHWQQGSHLMVLVVQGNESRYKSFWRPERDVPVV
jgi:hypothetical protein